MVREAKKDTTVLDIPVEFGGVSIGQTTCRLGLKISRTVLNLVAADEAFCGHRLTGKVILGQRDDQAGQEKMFDSDFEVNGSFDVKRIGVSADGISTGLTFSLADINVAELAKFSKGAGKLVVYGISELPDNAPDEHPEDRSEPAPRVPIKCEGDWREFPLNKLLKGKPLESLADASIKTVGKLSDYMSGAKLRDLDGIGPGAVDRIETAMRNFFEDNPGCE